MYARAWAVAAWGIASVAATAGVTANLAARQTTQSAAPEVTAITGCHLHASDLYCFVGTAEYSVDVTITATSDVPAQYTDCHSHGSEMYCVDKDGEDVTVHAEGGEEESHDHESESESEAESEGENQHCHFHAGVEHCTGESESSGPVCTAPSRDYDVGLRVGLLFVILATSGLGVFAPIILEKIWPSKLNLLLIVLKQFGTGIIISTAFIHLYTHANLMLTNDCLGELEYEGITSAIVMAGIFLSFIVEYIGHRVVLSKIKSDAAADATTNKANVWLSAEVVSILVMEAGIIFHSLLIGLTLVVAGDEFFITLFIVILFHQMFEGIALGSRIATIGTAADQADHIHRDNVTIPHDNDKGPSVADSTSQSSTEAMPAGLPMRKKLSLAALYAFITPIGMAIGIGVLDQFNGNDRSTLLAIGTLDAISAGILIWVGLVEMWASDWMVGAHGKKAELSEANALTVVLAGFGLVTGLVLMSVLGKWA